MSLSIHMALNITNLFNNSLWRFGVHLFLQVMCRHKLHLPNFLITPRNEKTEPEWQRAQAQPNLKQLACHLPSLSPPTVPVTRLLWHLDPLALPLVPEGFPVSFQWPLHFEPVQNYGYFNKWRWEKQRKKNKGL